MTAMHDLTHRGSEALPAPAAAAPEGGPGLDGLPRLHVLVVSAFFPYPPSWGAATRVYQLIRNLSAEHSVTLLTYAVHEECSYRSDLLEICDNVRLVPWQDHRGPRRRIQQAGALFSSMPFRGCELRTAAMQKAIDDCLDSGPFDIVQIEASPLMCLKYSTSARLVLDEHNIESELLRRQQQGERSWLRRRFNGLQARRQEKLEGGAWRAVDACVVTSEREVATVAGRAPGTRAVAVPNGVDPDYFTPATVSDAEPVDPHSIVFTGLMSYRPNLDGVRFFADIVLPLIRERHPKVKLTIVGGGNPGDLDALKQDGVVVTGRVPDVRPYLAGAACVVVPVRMGGGTRLKVVEGLSMGRPLVSTSLGCEGIAVRPEEHLLVADEPEEFASAVCRLLDDPGLGRRLGAAGRELVVSDYSWSHAAQGLSRLYRELARAEQT